MRIRTSMRIYWGKYEKSDVYPLGSENGFLLKFNEWYQNIQSTFNMSLIWVTTIFEKSEIVALSD